MFVRGPVINSITIYLINTVINSSITSAIDVVWASDRQCSIQSALKPRVSIFWLHKVAASEIQSSIFIR